MRDKKYVWGSEKRRREAKIHTAIGFIMALAMIIISVGSIVMAFTFCWVSVINFIMAKFERTKDMFEKLEAKNGKG